MRERVLVETLEYLWKQDFSCFEVIVVDQTPRHEPEVEAALTGMRERDNFHWLRAEGWANLPAARNRGLERAQGELVLFLDDDVILDGDYLSQLTKAFAESGADSVVGPVLQRGEDEPRSLADGIPNPEDPLGELRSAWVEGGRGCNMAFRCEVLGREGGLWFDPRYLGNAILEETDLFVRLRGRGGKVWLDERLPVIHLADRVGGCRAATFREGKRLPKHFVLFFHNHLLLGWKRNGFAGALSGGWKQYRRLSEEVSFQRKLFLFLALGGGGLRLLPTVFVDRGPQSSEEGGRFPVGHGDAENLSSPEPAATQ
ncbi:glycosyltransferase [Roseibacillus ishigakijimensis]|uniref:Glycosyltransferase n=2 Tax=Roseibacillus ishigakijimensis TaxID=454146 RepID=A0A934RKJ9_9BACT|nr:glycosyltransferase [Roseibacillus ishigakijimensis]